MKKTASKNKELQGCMKISSFFSKQTGDRKPTSLQKVAEKRNGTPILSNEIINLHTDDEESPSLLSFEVKRKLETSKRKLDNDNKTDLSPPLKKGSRTDLQAVSKSLTQPSTSGLTPHNSADNIDISEMPCIAPSTSGTTPVKNKPIFNVKSAEKLLSPTALKEFNSPEKIMERFLDKAAKKLTPVKLNFSDQNHKVTSTNIKQKVTPEKTENNVISYKGKKTTPPIRVKTPSKNSNKKSSGEKCSSTDSTPKKRRKTPKKLFDRSPNNINKFNVEVLRNFVKITPSKKEVEKRENNDQNCNRKSLEIQLQNEKTPIKDIMPSTSKFSPICKAKTKLDFSECSTSKSADKTPDKNSYKRLSENNRKLSGQKSVEENKPKESLMKVVKSGNKEKENLDLNNLGLYFEEDNWDADFFDHTEYTLDLTESQHCKVVNVSHRISEIILTVKSTRTNQQAICTLQGFWIHTKLCVGDTVHIMAIKLNDNNWLVDNQKGFLVYEPDLLVSTTAVVGAVFCKRKTILQEKFRSYDGSNKFMIVGSMVHSLLQEVLKNKLYNYKDIEMCARAILKRKEWVRQIYESDESLITIEQDFMIYVSKVHDFVGTYVQNGVKKINPKPYKKDDWKGVISAIDDIEENIWCPDLGIKGKVDVSLKNGLETIPLEVKSGRATVSLQHRGQVLLYIMMMNKLGYRVSSGLLLYLKEGILKEIPPTASEKRDIMILRNELAYFLTRKPRVIRNSDELYLEPGEVPEPIDHHACKTCPYNAICAAYSKYTNEDISSKKSLQEVHNQLSNFLTSAHIDYFMHWSSLLNIEMLQRNGQKDLRDIYTLPPNERRNKGKCLINLKVAHISEECNGTVSHTFSENNSDGNSSQATNFLLSGFTENTYVVVSVDNRPAISTGFVTDISAESVTVALDKQPASFQSKLPRVLADKAKPILKRLNRVQQRAVLKAIAANEYFLIKGMPGTGKTATIVALIQLLLELKKSVLITSHTHSAVDNVCLKLIQFGVKFMRLGSEAKMDAKLRVYSEQNLTKDCTTPEDLEKVYNEVQVLAVTCLGSGHPVLSKRTMDFCIVDESTQVLQCSVFRPLYASKTFILIGDPDQLPAVVRSKDALELGMNESLFERLNSDESRITLNLNYRMNESITGLANALTYNGDLLIGADRIATATMNIPKLQELTLAYKDQTWILKALDTSLENAVQFIDTGPVWNVDKEVSWARTESYEESASENQKCVNIFEAAVIFHLVNSLINKGGVLPNEIGVICTYRAQVAQLSDLLQSTMVAVNTVDQFQGKDKSIVIYSCSKSKDPSKKQEQNKVPGVLFKAKVSKNNSTKKLDKNIARLWAKINKFDLLEDKRRLNVAITRAKHKLIIVGDFATLHNYSTFKKIQEYLEKNVIKLLETDGFNWENILDLKFKYCENLA